MVNKPTNSVSKPYLLSPKTDWLTVGGLSILILPILFLIPYSTKDTVLVGWFFYALAFLVNYPHFTVSYQLLYKDYGKLILTDFRFFWAAVIVPILMVVYIMWAHFTQSIQMLTYFVQFMFVIVGWHYTKQAYGVVLVTSSMHKYFYSNLEKGILKFNMYALWMTSFLSLNIGMFEQPPYWGITYMSLNFPITALYTAYGLTAGSLLVGGVLMLRRISKTKQWPPTISIIGFASIYAWFLPVLFNPIFFLAIPFFHSIQYFTFVFALKKKEEMAKSHSLKRVLSSLVIFTTIAIVSGALLFEGIPRLLNEVIDYNHSLFGEGLFLFLFSVFINIHHYFIDNVIWRKDNEKVKSYLFD